MTPPAPNPITGTDIAFSGVTDDEMTITVSNVSDAGGSTPVEYLFTGVTGAGVPSSSWQTSNVYNPTGLTKDTTYGWTVTTRDSVPNAGSASAEFQQATTGVCGDGVTDSDETCDDGAGAPLACTYGDSPPLTQVCNATCDGNTDCTSPEFCGDGVLQAGQSEECDDGNTTPGDGCSATCTTEAVSPPVLTNGGGGSGGLLPNDSGLIPN